MSKIKAVLCDFDDTLAPTWNLYKEAVDVSYEVFMQRTSLNLSKEEYRKLYDKAKKEVMELMPTAAASHNRILYFQRVIEDLNITTDFNIVDELYNAYYSHIYRNIKLYPSAMEFIDWVKSSGKKLVVVSDGSTHIRIQKMINVGIAKKVDYLVTSEEVGVEKPNSQVFLVALNKAKVSSSDAIFIGNNSRRDIFGAKSVGLKTIWVNIGGADRDQPNSDEEKADFEVGDLSQLQKIIQKLEK